MKINVKLLLITFVIVCLISVTTAFIYFSLTVKILEQQQKKGLTNQKNNISVSLRQLLTDMDVDIYEYLSANQEISKFNIDSSKIDLLFLLRSDSLMSFKTLITKKNLPLKSPVSNYRQLKEFNPNILMNYYQLKNGETVFYGKIISEETLNNFLLDDRFSLILMGKDKPVLFSVEDNNIKHHFVGESKRRNLENEIEEEQYGNFDYYFADLKTNNLLFSGDISSVIICLRTDEINQFASTMQATMVIIVVAGSLLSLIFILLFTVRIRKQILSLDFIANKVKAGSISDRAEVITKDEIGSFAETFNSMLAELEIRQDEENRYEDFLTLINSNPTLEQVAETSIKNLTNSLGYLYGLLYIIEDRRVVKIVSYGIESEKVIAKEKLTYLSKVIENKEIIRKIVDDKNQQIQTGFLRIPIKLVLLYPIIYNNNVIAVIELAAESEKNNNDINYLNKIKDQLAIGLANANAYNKLEKLVTDLQKLNEEYQKQNDQIRYKNKELIELHTTLQTKAAELQREKTKALELTKLKSDFLASMSHELRTPLNSILGLSELMVKRKSKESDVKNDINMIVKNSKLLLSLINNILEFSRIESGKIELKNDILKFSDLLAELNDIVYPIAQQKKLRFIVENNLSEEFEFFTDKEKLIQILVNVLSNAVKFTETGYIKLSAIVNLKSEIQFEITDTGIGISEKEQENIFDEFRQLEGGLSRKYGGTGLGLSIAKKYIDLLGGKIAIESEKGVGSIFTITIPIDVSNYSKSVNRKITDQQKRKTILILNDQDETSELFSNYFKLNDLDITIIRESENLYTNIDENIIGVILNAKIDNRETWTLLKELLRKKELSDIPVIISGFNTFENLGYALFVYDYKLQGKINLDLSNVVAKMNANNFNIKNICFLTDEINSEEKNNLVSDEFDIQLIEINEDLISELIVREIDLILLPLSLNEYTNAPEILRDIKRNKSTREIPVIVLISENMTSEEGENLNKSFDKILLGEKFHPLDVLKFIRTRLNITENTRALNSLFKEELNTSDSNSSKLNAKNKILVVDDDNDTLYTVGEIIKDLGYDVVFARNGLECIAQQRKEQPDLILLDIMMPQMDGFETIKRLRKIYDAEKLPVIALTAYAMIENRETIDKNGFNDLITKPLRRAEIEMKLSKIFKAGSK